MPTISPLRAMRQTAFGQNLVSLPIRRVVIEGLASIDISGSALPVPVSRYRQTLQHVENGVLRVHLAAPVQAPTSPVRFALQAVVNASVPMMMIGIYLSAQMIGVALIGCYIGTLMLSGVLLYTAAKLQQGRDADMLPL